MFRYRHLLRRLFFSIVAAILVCLTLATNVLAVSDLKKTESELVGPKSYYLALGDSLGAGYQPGGRGKDGYPEFFFQDLKEYGVKEMKNLSCVGETTYTMVWGWCPRNTKPLTTQLTRALKFLRSHPGQVSPVTLDIGGNDVLGDVDPKTCSVNKTKFSVDLVMMGTYLENIILPALQDALTVKGEVTGDILVMNYYFPYQNICPDLISYSQIFNKRIAIAVSKYGTLVDVFEAFGGKKTPNPHLCSYTWMCHSKPDIHATNKGYQVIADAFKQTANYH